MSFFKRLSNSKTARVHVNVAINGVTATGNQLEIELGRRVIIPADLMLGAWRQLFPAERMMVFGGRKIRTGAHVTSASDVTRIPESPVHVHACPEKLTRCLVDLERTGAQLAAWVHSHPGRGIKATFPSDIDRQEHEKLRRDFGDDVVGIIAVEDGWLRAFSLPVQGSQLEVTWLGSGIESAPGEPHVFRIRVP
jgi:proteasome lid subunit RPN8/RPN11